MSGEELEDRIKIAGVRAFAIDATIAYREVEYFADEWIPVGDRLVRVGGIAASVGRAG